MSHPVVLLGAGASKPAGVPTAIEMTERMIGRASQAPELIECALRIVCSALEMHMAAFGQARSYTPDIERVLDAAQQLGDRHELELTPFVASWHPAIEALETPSVSPFEASRIAHTALFFLPKVAPPRLFSSLMSLEMTWNV
jgi:hypothetical protein